MSIRLRLTAWYTAILAVTLIVFGSAVYGVVHYNTYNSVRERLVQQYNKIARTSVVLNSNARTGDYFSFQTPADLTSQTYVQMIDYINNKLTISRNLGDLNINFPYPDYDHAVKQQGFKPVSIQGNPFYLYQGVITEGNTGQIIATLQVAIYTGHEVELLTLLRNILVISATIMIIVASSLGLFLASKSMSPIGNVIEAASQIQNGQDLSVRIDYDGPQDEVGQLIDTVNSMLARMEGFYKNLEESYATQRRFVSDASHELRTPLTTIRGNVDLLEKMWSDEEGDRPKLDEATLKQMTREAISDIADESKRMSRLVGDMLSLARADTGRTFDKQPIPLEILVEEVARRAQFLPRQADWITGDFSILNGVYVNGNKDYMQQMLFIFIENAFKYTPEGQVTFDALLYEDQVGIRIADTGIGMDKDEVPYIFDRFYRADQSRGMTEGIGLGLSIAKWIIDELNGSVEVVTRQGEGTTFIIWLPVVFPVPLE